MAALSACPFCQACGELCSQSVANPVKCVLCVGLSAVGLCISLGPHWWDLWQRASMPCPWRLLSSVALSWLRSGVHLYPHLSWTMFTPYRSLCPLKPPLPHHSPQHFLLSGLSSSSQHSRSGHPLPPSRILSLCSQLTLALSCPGGLHSLPHLLPNSTTS